MLGLSLNDLNRMIGKVNEHVKDLSAIQARLYNELVGEEEIIIDPVRVEEEKVVKTDTAIARAMQSAVIQHSKMEDEGLKFYRNPEFYIFFPLCF